MTDQENPLFAVIHHDHWPERAEPRVTSDPEPHGIEHICFGDHDVLAARELTAAR